MKTYSNKSNARRAAKAAGLDVEAVTFVQNAEGRYWEAVETPVVDQAVAEAIAEVDTRAEDAALAALEPVVVNGRLEDEAELHAVVAQMAKDIKLEKEKEYKKEVAKMATKGLKIERNRDEQNGVKRPSVGSTCRQLWDMFDAMYAEKGIVPTPAPAKAKSAEQGMSPVTTTVQLYQWRAFMGFKGR
ncbi:MAG: hypothetical protein ACRDCY_18310 [Aeromonas veronii]